MAADARALAWEVLRRVEETGAFADALLGNRLTNCGLERRDQALVTQLVYGTLAWRGFLDCAIETFSKRPAAVLEPPIRSLLEMALYQLFELDKVPAYAAVSRAVDLAKTYRGGRAAKLVNAVLRHAAAEGKAAVALPDPRGDPAGYLAARCSHPRWLVERWLDELGAEATEALLWANNQPAPTVLRVNRRRMSRDDCLAQLQARGIAAVPTAMAPDGIAVAAAGAPAALPGFDSGSFSVQSEASQLAALLLAPAPGERVLDACAGSGGKSTYLAELMDDRGLMVAFDRHAQPLRRLGAETHRLGLSCVHAAAADALRLPLGEGTSFDRILLDAPCSGLGTLRQHPEIRWRRQPADLAASAALQRRLLSASLDRLRRGGSLVYATCTIAREENDDVVAAVLRQRADIEPAHAAAVLPASARPAVGADGALRTMPHVQGLDGFYAVLLKRL